MTNGQLRRYRVSATLQIDQECYVMAHSPEEAIEEAEALAMNGAISAEDWQNNQGDGVWHELLGAGEFRVHDAEEEADNG